MRLCTKITYTRTRTHTQMVYVFLVFSFCRRFARKSFFFAFFCCRFCDRSSWVLKPTNTDCYLAISHIYKIGAKLIKQMFNFYMCAVYSIYITCKEFVCLYRCARCMRMNVYVRCIIGYRIFLLLLKLILFSSKQCRRLPTQTRTHTDNV